MPREDLTILLNVNPKTGQENVNGKRERLGIIRDVHEQNLSHLQKAAQIYLDLAEKEKWNVINCMNGEQMKSIEETHEEIVNILKPLFTK